MRTYKIWTTKEVARLCQLYPITKGIFLAVEFPGRTYHSIRNRARELGLKPERPRPKQSKWLEIPRKYKPVIFWGAAVRPPPVHPITSTHDVMILAHWRDGLNTNDIACRLGFLEWPGGQPSDSRCSRVGARPASGRPEGTGSGFND
jgi:hypothetical protein